MTQKLILVDVQYNGMRPRVSISISWKRMLSGFWQNVKDFGNKVKNFLQYVYKMRNVYTLNMYSSITWVMMLLLVVEGMIRVKAADWNLNVFTENLWNEWTEFLGGFGIVMHAHQVGLFALLLALISVICAPATKWDKYYFNLKADKTLSKDIRKQLLSRRADAMVDGLNSAVAGTCLWIVKIAAGTVIVWMVWTMLQG